MSLVITAKLNRTVIHIGDIKIKMNRRSFSEIRVVIDAPREVPITRTEDPLEFPYEHEKKESRGNR
jgi:sRNA-binding carbon storage regulator CsrA